MGMRTSIVLFTLLGLATPARADNGVALLGGINVGLGFNETAKDSAVFGGELSFVRLWMEEATPHLYVIPQFDQLFWAGGYVDVIHDYGSDTTRLSLGPEVGWKHLGLDAGVLMQLGDTKRVGVTIRPVVTFAVLALYGRYGHFTDDMPDANFYELGLLVKLPVPLR